MSDKASDNVSPIPEGAGAVALLQSRDGMSAELFSRYWRDVHGVLATRIPGFTSYRQYHLDRAPAYSAAGGAAPMQLDGIAEVLFAPAQADAGLIDSRVAELIRADERNVFARAYLHNLPAGASRLWSPESYDRDEHLVTADSPGLLFVLFQKAGSHPPEALQLQLEALLIGLRRTLPHMRILHSHLLAAGDTSWWSTPGVDNGPAGAPFGAAVKIHYTAGGSGDDNLALLSKMLGREAQRALGPAIIYRVKQRYVMVHNGQPTEIGLRGLDTMRTIWAAQAQNQREPELLRALYRYP